MTYKLIKFQNTTPWDFDNKPTIVITEEDSNWEKIHQNWIDGKNPTNSKEWKKGIFACTKRIKEK